MEASSVRSRYAGRRPVQLRPMRGRGRIRETRHRSLKKLIAFQALVCTLLFIILVIAKTINISAANYLIEKVRYVLSHNVELKSALAYAKNLAADIRTSIVAEPDAGKAAEADLHVDAASDSSYTPTLSNTMEESTEDVNPAEKEVIEHIEEDAAEPAEKEAIEPAGKSVLSASSHFPLSADSNTALSAGVHSAILPDMISPVDGILVTPFGKINSNTAYARMHAGIDICVEKQSIVKAALAGEVSETGSTPEYGKYIRIRHDNVFETVYAHCCIPIVHEGDVVNRGDAIAHVEDKSVLGGQHLHFEIWKDGEAVNPLEYISVDVR